LEVCGTAGLETCATKNEMRPASNEAQKLAFHAAGGQVKYRRIYLIRK
jgi:hypothetical protein